MNLSTHTLRYYEKRGLIKVDRDQSGQRFYDENDLAWVQFFSV
nr:MerR family DNA-binding transcriptional regulator [Streptococcus sanguinis]